MNLYMQIYALCAMELGDWVTDPPVPVCQKDLLICSYMFLFTATRSCTSSYVMGSTLWGCRDKKMNYPKNKCGT